MCSTNTYMCSLLRLLLGVCISRLCDRGSSMEGSSSHGDSPEHQKEVWGRGGNPLQTHWNPSRSSYVFRCCSLVGDRPPTSCIKHGDQAAHYNTGLAALLPHSVSRVSAKSVTICPTQSWRRIGSRKGVLECSVWVGHASHVFVGLFDRDSPFRIANVFMMGCIYSIYT